MVSQARRGADICDYVRTRFRGKEEVHVQIFNQLQIVQGTKNYLCVCD